MCSTFNVFLLSQESSGAREEIDRTGGERKRKEIGGDRRLGRAHFDTFARAHESFSQQEGAISKCARKLGILCGDFQFRGILARDSNLNF